MNETLDIIAEFNGKESVTLNEILTKFHVNDFSELFECLTDVFKEKVKDDDSDKSFFTNFYYFVLTHLISNISSRDDAVALNQFYKSLKGIFSDELKPYNKGEIDKDGRYNVLNSIYNQYKGLDIYLKDLIDNNNRNNRFKIIWFIISELHNPDYLFRIFELHPEYVNLKDENKTSLFIYICKYYMVNLKNLASEEITFYKRVIVMLLESDKLSLTNDELFSLLKMIENNKRSASADELIHLSFISNEIDRHYEVINKDARLNCVDYCFRECPLSFIRRSNKTRVDLRSDFTFSIDSIRGKNFESRLFDDAFSYRDNGDGSYTLFMHIPDVDFFIKKDSETDLYMRSIGESVYAKGYKRPMLSYQAAKVCSLNQGEDKPAITFAIKVSNDGKVLDVNFYKSIIKVNYNLSTTSADIFANHLPDERFKVLNSMKRLLVMMCKNRKCTVGGRSTSHLIVDEMNIITDLATASYFEQNGIIFPYKNFRGLRSKRSVEDVSKCEEFARLHDLGESDLELLYSIFDINNRVYYDTINHGNTEFNGQAVGNVGNPLRQYISLETDRLIKDVVISGEKNIDFWLERIERDCIEYTETSAKIKQLYGKK